MIAANELRIGNLLRLNNPEHRPDEHGKILKVVGVTEEYPLVQLLHDPNRIMSFGQFWHFLEPIPIDEIWLNQLGFEHKQILIPSQWIKGDFIALTIGMDGASLLSESCESEIMILHPKYVHQVQNLFFALTGTELQFSNDLK